MESDTQRGTFLAVEDMLRREQERCLKAHAELQSVAGDSEDPQAMVYASLADIEREIAQVLGEFARSGPENLLATRLQYSPTESELSSPDDAAQAVANLVTLNREVCENLREMSGNLAPPDLEEDLQDLCVEVESLSRKLSMKSVTLGDE